LISIINRHISYQWLVADCGTAEIFAREHRQYQPVQKGHQGWPYNGSVQRLVLALLIG
jgi:hypothetical protein